MIVLYIILGIIAAFLIVALFVSKDIKATKEIVINKSQDAVMSYVKYLKNQDNYSKWASMDPNMKSTYKGVDGEPGFISAWEGNKKVGAGEQEIKVVTANALHTELRFIKPFKSLANSTIEVNGINATSSKVRWGFTSKMKYPMNGIKLFMNMGELVGKDFEIGLQNLKKVLEK